MVCIWANKRMPMPLVVNPNNDDMGSVMTSKAKRAELQTKLYEKMNRKELQEEMAKTITASIMKLVEVVVKQRVSQFIEVVADQVREMEKKKP